MATHATLSAPPASAADFVVLNRKSQKNRSVNKPLMRVDKRGNIYLTKPLVRGLGLQENDCISFVYDPNNVKDWFIFPVSSTDPDAFVIKFRRNSRLEEEEAQATASEGIDSPGVYGVQLNCKGICQEFFEKTQREPGTYSFLVALEPTKLTIPGHPHHDRCFPILTSQHIS